MKNSGIALGMQLQANSSEPSFASVESIYSVWEHAEVSRSAVAARETAIGPDHFARYANPPGDTAFPLEYAFHLLGNIAGKVVVDFGCGSGENLPILARRGASAIGIDISPDLLQIAAERLSRSGVTAELRETSIYNAGLPSGSVDVVFCIAILHHLDLPRARAEMLRILRHGGTAIVMEPVRDSSRYERLRRMIPARQEDVSQFERPLTSAELREFAIGFDRLDTRRFRLPFIPLLDRLGVGSKKIVWKADRWLVNSFPGLQKYATVEVSRLVKNVEACQVSESAGVAWWSSTPGQCDLGVF